MSFLKIRATIIMWLMIVMSGAAFAQSFDITDVAGRKVHFDKPAQRVVLGEGRMLYAIASVVQGDPFARIVGWRNDLKNNDGDGYNAYVAKLLKAKDIPFLGNIADGTLQTETLVDLNPDLVLLSIGSKTAADESGLEGKLADIGIKLVYIDFREHILANTEPSLGILGKVLDSEKKAGEVAAFWKEQLARVTDKIKAANPAKPNVFMYRAPGFGDCCGTFGPDNFGLMTELAGGHNLGSDFLPGYTGTINPEQVVDSNPDIVVATGANWSNSKDMGAFVNVGPGAATSAENSRKTLQALMEQPAFVGTKAFKNGNVHAIWHQFYTSPYQFVAVQQLARWFHPDLFADLDPEQTFRDFHQRFLPIPYQPGYWLDLKATGAN